MALAPGQWQIRNLIMGRGTPYRVRAVGTNPWGLTVRADQGGSRAWAHGRWSGAEWGERTVPFQIVTVGTDGPDWLNLHQQLAAAWRPTGDETANVELRFEFGGREYLVLGKPRGIEPDSRSVAAGVAVTQAQFQPMDAKVFSGDLKTAGPVELPRLVGGLKTPLTTPLIVSSVQVGGQVAIVNDGTADTALLVRLDGPVLEPRITLQRPDGVIQTVHWFNFELPLGRFLIVDTDARTAFLDGLETSSQYPGFVQWPIAPEGASVLQFRAADFTTATMSVSWRDAWW